MDLSLTISQMAFAVPLRHAPTARTSSSDVASGLFGPTRPIGAGITRTSRPRAIGRPASTPRYSRSDAMTERYRRLSVRVCASLLRAAGGASGGAAGVAGAAALFISAAIYRL